MGSWVGDAIMMLLPLVILLLLPLFKAQEVVLPQGRAEGEMLTSRDGLPYSAFRSLPYALPPVGDLRWSKPLPAPIPGWEGTRNASVHPPACPQYGWGYWYGDEDCLYLNVFTSQITEAGLIESEGLKPVMVYIHGGGYTGGQGFHNEEAGFLIDEGVILVSINYRLGFFGFLSADTQEVSGNQGLRDQALALTWVKDNLKYFGGDPDQVTIFGESAGGWSVSQQVLNPGARGLFKGAIVESGPITGISWGAPISRELAREISATVGTELGCYSGGDWMDEVGSVISCLRSKSTSDIATAAASTGFYPFANVDDFTETPVLPRPPQELLDTGSFNQVPVMLGVNSGEHIMFSTDILNNLTLLDKYSQNWEVECPLLIYSFLDPSFIGPHVTEYCQAAMDFYFNNSLGQDDMQRMLDFLNDVHFFRATDTTARSLAAYVPTYQYLLTFRDETSFTSVGGPNYWNEYLQYGVSHCDDFFYIFKFDLDYSNWSELNWFTSRAMTSMWANFAKLGDPTPPGSPAGMTWQPVDPEEQKYLEIGDQLVMTRDPWWAERMDFWDNIIADRK